MARSPNKLSASDAVKQMADKRLKARDLVGYTTLYLMVLLPVVFFLCWFFARTIAFIPPMK